MAHKPLIWIGSARAALRAFPDLARREAGYDLWFIQIWKGSAKLAPNA